MWFDFWASRKPPKQKLVYQALDKPTSTNKEMQTDEEKAKDQEMGVPEINLLAM